MVKNSVSGAGVRTQQVPHHQSSGAIWAKKKRQINPLLPPDAEPCKFGAELLKHV